MPLPPLPPLHHSVCVFVRFALPLPLYPLISSLNKRNGHAECTDAYMRTLEFTHLGAHTERLASKRDVQTHTVVQKTQILISVDMQESTHWSAAPYSHTHTPPITVKKISSYQVSPSSTAYWPLEGSRGLWPSNILIRTFHTHTHMYMNTSSDTGSWPYYTVKSWSSDTHSLYD